MLISKIIFIIISITLISCKTQNIVTESISCKNNYIVQYDKKRDNYYPLADKNMMSTTVYFIEEYNDEIKCYINEELVFEKHLKTPSNSDRLHDNFICKISKDKTLPTIKIESTTQNTCIDLKVNTKYKLLYVYLSRNGEWIVRYSNRYMIYA